MTTTATATAFLVQRYRRGEGAPSLSLGYTASTPDAALAAHFERYRGGVADGERYVVLVRGGSERTTFDTFAARRIARRA